MNTLTNVRNILLLHKTELNSKFPIKYLAIFGSICRMQNTENSDIDILVEFTKPVGIEFIDLADELEKMLKSKVDLVSKNGIKPKYYEAIKKDLIYV